MAPLKGYILPSGVYCAATHGEAPDTTLCHKRKKGMILTDIHTHNTERQGRSIYNSGAHYLSEIHISMGIHPWKISEAWREELLSIAESAKADNVVAIGECGIDKLKSTVSTELQEKVFKAHIELSEKLHKPLIIHCVKAYDRILALHRENKPAQAWIIHGFRGKPNLARQLIRAGLHLSFGEHFNADSVAAVPDEKILIESDESIKSIQEIYNAIAAARGTAIEELAMQTEKNATIFGQFILL